MGFEVLVRYPHFACSKHRSWRSDRLSVGSDMEADRKEQAGKMGSRAQIRSAKETGELGGYSGFVPYLQFVEVLSGSMVPRVAVVAAGGTIS
jgi:hypothetical protein